MSKADEIRATVARAIYESGVIYVAWDRLSPRRRQAYLQQADAAIRTLYDFDVQDVAAYAETCAGDHVEMTR